MNRETIALLVIAFLIGWTLASVLFGLLLSRRLRRLRLEQEERERVHGFTLGRFTGVR